VSLVPQLAHLKPTSRAGDPIMAHCASLAMKDTEPQLWQANPFCSITSCRHCARSPETYYLQANMPPSLVPSDKNHSFGGCAVCHWLLSFRARERK
jgi:hypothetical protein